MFSNAFQRVLAVFVTAMYVAASGTGVLAADQKSADPIVATVNGETIHQSMVNDARSLLPPEMQQVPITMLYPVLVNRLIDTILVADEARRQGYDKKKDIQRRIKRINDQVLERAFLVKYIEKRVTEKALKAKYQMLVDKTKNQNEVHARHILVKTEKKAEELIKKLKKGADFAKLAKEHSKGPSGEKGGDLGFFRKEQMVAPFSKAAFAMKKNEVSKKPVQTQFGWHVIKVEDRRVAKPPAVEAVREQLVSDLSNDIGTELIKKLRKKAKIDIRSSGGSALDSGAKKQ